MVSRPGHYAEPRPAECHSAGHRPHVDKRAGASASRHSEARTGYRSYRTEPDDLRARRLEEDGRTRGLCPHEMAGSDDSHQIDRATPCRTVGTGTIDSLKPATARLGEKPEPDCESLEYLAPKSGCLSGGSHYRTLSRDPGPYEEGVGCLARNRGALAAPMSPTISDLRCHRVSRPLSSILSPTGDRSTLCRDRSRGRTFLNRHRHSEDAPITEHKNSADTCGGDEPLTATILPPWRSLR